MSSLFLVFRCRKGGRDYNVPIVPIIAWQSAAGVVAGLSMTWHRKNEFTVTRRAAAVPPGEQHQHHHPAIGGNRVRHVVSGLFLADKIL